MKKGFIIAAVGTAALLLGGCGTGHSGASSASKASQTQSAKAKPKTKPKAKSKKAASATNKAASSSSRTTPAGPIWSVAKSQALATFMASWQRAMGQTYQGTYSQAAVNYLGTIFPDNTDRPDFFKVFGQVQSLTWSSDGTGTERFRVVEAAVGGESDAIWPYLYLFAIVNGRPVVLMSQSTNGSRMYLYQTANTDLQQGFAKIARSGNAKLRPTDLPIWTAASAQAYLTALAGNPANTAALKTAKAVIPQLTKLSFKGPTTFADSPDYGVRRLEMTANGDGTTTVLYYDNDLLPATSDSDPVYTWTVRDATHQILR